MYFFNYLVLCIVSKYRNCQFHLQSSNEKSKNRYYVIMHCALIKSPECIGFICLQVPQSLHFTDEENDVQKDLTYSYLCM